MDVIILSETWLKPHNIGVYSLKGYHHEFMIREHKSGGGLSIFIKDNINYKIRNDLKYQSEDSEMLWVELTRDNSFFEKNLVVGGIYR